MPPVREAGYDHFSLLQANVIAGVATLSNFLATFECGLVITWTL